MVSCGRTPARRRILASRPHDHPFTSYLHFSLRRGFTVDLIARFFGVAWAHVPVHCIRRILASSINESRLYCMHILILASGSWSVVH